MLWPLTPSVYLFTCVFRGKWINRWIHKCHLKRNLYPKKALIWHEERQVSDKKMMCFHSQLQWDWFKLKVSVKTEKPCDRKVKQEAFELNENMCKTQRWQTFRLWGLHGSAGQRDSLSAVSDAEETTETCLFGAKMCDAQTVRKHLLLN